MLAHRPSSMEVAVTFIVSCLLWEISTVSGTEWFVSKRTGSDAADCRDRQHPCLTIRRAVEHSESDDIINVEPSHITNDVYQAERDDVVSIEPSHTIDDVYHECSSGPIKIVMSLTFRSLDFVDKRNRSNASTASRAVVDCYGGKVAFEVSNCSHIGGRCKVTFIGFVFRNVTTALDATDASVDIVSCAFHCARNESEKLFPNWWYCLHVYGGWNTSVKVAIRDSQFSNLTNGALKASDPRSVELSNVKFTSSDPKVKPTFEKVTYALVYLLYYYTDFADVNIYHCDFQNNTNYIADIYAQTSPFEQRIIFTIADTRFNFSGSRSGQVCYPMALFLFETNPRGGFKLSVKNCSFLNHPSQVFHLQRNSDYRPDTTYSVEDSLFTFAPTNALLDKCKFEGHQSHIRVRGSKIKFSNCTFVKKTNLNRVLHLSGTDTELEGCTFDSVEARGGNLIYSSDGDLRLENTSVISANSSGHNIGDVLYAVGPGKLELLNTSITVAYNIPGNLVFVAVEMGGLVWEDSRLACPQGFGAESLTPRGTSSEGTLFISCTPCPSGRYSVDAGVFTGGRNASGPTRSCQECPYGAQCDGTTVSALNNFWGTVSDSLPKHMEMVLCPFGYCCDAPSCDNFSTCSNNRTGRLCGECMVGFTRQLYSARCVPVSDCRHKNFWISVGLVSISVGTLFVLYLMGYGVPTFCKKIFMKNNNKRSKRESSLSLYDISNTAWSKFTRECAVVPKGAFLFSVFYFYQTLSLLLEGDRYDVQDGDIDSWVRNILLFFNLRIPYSSTVLCPFVDMTAADKLLLELLLYVASLYAALFLLGVFLSMARLCCRRNPRTRDTGDEAVPFIYRVARAATSIASLSQTNIALSCFYLLHCVDLDNHKVFFYNGNLSCDALRWWQTAAVVVLGVHTVPFILATLLRPFYQRKYDTGLCGVLVAYHLPIGFVGCVVGKAFRKNNQEPPDSDRRQNLKFVTNYVDCAYETSPSQTDSAGTDAHVNPKCAFEAANFLLRFLIITMNIFTNWSPLTRAFGNFLLLTLYLLLVFFVSPYGSPVLNVSAKVCSVVLNFVAGSQIIHAGFHQAGFVWTRQGLPFYEVSILLRRTTTALQFGGPFLMVLVVSIGWLFHSEPDRKVEMASFVSGETEGREHSRLSSVHVDRQHEETTPLILRKRSELHRKMEASDS